MSGEAYKAQLEGSALNNNTRVTMWKICFHQLQLWCIYLFNLYSYRVDWLTTHALLQQHPVKS